MMVDGKNDILGIHGFPIVKLYALFQVEGPYFGIG